MTDQPDLRRGESRTADSNSSIVVDLTEYKQNKDPLPVTFQRRELDAVLWIYGRMVGEGEWRDYAIDHLKDRAVFSVFKRSGEMPLFRIEKTPSLLPSRAPILSSTPTASFSSADTTFSRYSRFSTSR